MTLPFRNAILHFKAGTGFLVRGADGNVYGITCAHVVNQTLGRKQRESTPPGPDVAVLCNLPYAGNQHITARIAAWCPPYNSVAFRTSPVHDIAVLRFDEDPRSAASLVLRLEPPERVAPEGCRLPFESFGFMGPLEGLPFSGLICGIDAGGWLVADAENDIGQFVEEGASGAPLLGRGAVLGMSVERFELKQRQALAVPAFALAQAFPALSQPYVGLSAFGEDTAHLFHGRSQRVAELLARLDAHPRLAVLGASGSGKSSLVLAGLIPALRSRGWLSIVFRPGRPSLRPSLNLAEALVRATGQLGSSALVAEAETLADKLAQDPAALSLRLKSLREESGAKGILVVIDQAEEFFTPAAVDPRRRDERAALLGELLRLTSFPGPSVLACVLTARTDLLAPLGEREDTVPFLADPLWLTAMNEAELADAIRAPAALFGVTVDETLVEGLLEQMRGEPGLLPALEVTLDDLWPSIRQEKQQAWRLPTPIEGAPRIADAIAARADTVIAALPPGVAPALERVLSRLVRVVAGKGARRVVRRAETTADEWKILAALAEARLVTIVQREAEPETATAELVHETLISRWPPLHRHVAEDATFLRFRDGLDADLRRWQEENRSDERLLQSRACDAALRWLAERGDSFDQAQRAFIEASRGHWTAQNGRRVAEAQARTRRAQLIGHAFGVIGGVCFLFAMTALFMTWEAHDQRESALRLESRVLVNRAREAIAAGDLELAYLIAAQAGSWPGAGGLERRPQVAEAEAMLREAAILLTAAKLKDGIARLDQTGSHVVVFDPLGGRKTLYALAGGRVTRVSEGEAAFLVQVKYAAISIDKERNTGLIIASNGMGDGTIDAVDLTSLSLKPIPELKATRGGLPGLLRLTTDLLPGPPPAALITDPTGQRMLLRLTPLPVLLGIPPTTSSSLAHVKFRLHPASDLVVAFDQSYLDPKPPVLYRIPANPGADALQIVETFPEMVDVGFFDGGLIALDARGNILTRTIQGGAPWVNRGAIPTGSIGELHSGAKVVQVAGRVFRSQGDKLSEIALPKGWASVVGGATVQVVRDKAVDLVDISDTPRLFATFPNETTKLWETRVFAPDDPGQPVVFVLLDRKLVAVRRDGTASDLPIAVAEGTDLADNGVDVSADGSIAVVRLSEGRGNAVVRSSLIVAARGGHDDPVLDAERQLARCLTPAEAADLVGVPADRVKQATPVATEGRHACPSLAALAAEPDGYWDFWRPLAREILGALSTPAAPEPAHRR